jgi:hypothetical protein
MGTIYYGSTGWYVDLTFTGLDPAEVYTFATSSSRANPAYTDRVTQYTLIGADTFTHASTTGVTEVTPDPVYFNTGDNISEGYVARWTGISAVDGSFTVRAERGGRRPQGLCVRCLHAGARWRSRTLLRRRKRRSGRAVRRRQWYAGRWL